MYMSARHQEGLAHLLYGMDFGGGFVALTGEVGTGKTTLCHCLLQQLPKNIDVALILNSKLNVLELLATLCDELTINYDKHQASLKTLVDLLNHYLLAAHAKGRRTVLLIDEAQNLSLDVLEQIRLLTNLETSKTKLLRIILVGQPELKDLLQKKELRQLNQRITARYHLQPLSKQETRAYIRHRLRVSQGHQDIFNESALRKIYQLSAGIPRLINILCDRALLGAYSTNVTVINSAIIELAAKEVLTKADKKLSVFNVFLGLFFMVSIMTSLYFSSYKQTDIKQVLLTLAAKPFDLLPAFKSEEKPLPSAEKIKHIPTTNTLHFDEWINNPLFSLDTALLMSLKSWGKTIPENHKVDCQTLESTGLRCVMGEATWKTILALKQPVILEFPFSETKKYHALVTGFGQNQSVIYFSDKISYPVADVLKYWNGYYLTLIAPPIPDVKWIASQQPSDNVVWLRYILNTFDGKSVTVDKPRAYDNALSERIKIFQHQHHLKEDGKVGAKTLDHLKNLARAVEFSQLEIIN
jgi:general secretion pathway protein A